MEKWMTKSKDKNFVRRLIREMKHFEGELEERCDQQEYNKDWDDIDKTVNALQAVRYKIAELKLHYEFLIKEMDFDDLDFDAQMGLERGGY